MPEEESLEEFQQKAQERRKRFKVVRTGKLTYAKLRDDVEGERKQASEVSEALKRAQEATGDEAVKIALEKVHEWVETRESLFHVLLHERVNLLAKVEEEAKKEIGRATQIYTKSIQVHNKACQQYLDATDGLIRTMKAYEAMTHYNKEIAEAEKAYVKQLNKNIGVFNDLNISMLHSIKMWDAMIAHLNKTLADFDNMIDDFYKAFQEIQPYRKRKRRKKK